MKHIQIVNARATLAIIENADAPTCERFALHVNEAPHAHAPTLDEALAACVAKLESL